MTECRVQRDGCAVPTRALAGVVREWVDQWERDHPDLVSARRMNGRRIGGGGSRRNELGQLRGNETVGAVTILHERTQALDMDARGVPTKRLRQMLQGSGASYTELRTADLIVTAIERPDVFHDGTLPVVPNPRASTSAREASSCCGGALTGVVEAAA